jgi:hypothetical protein
MQRDLSINYLKGLLVLGMVPVHAYALLTTDRERVATFLSTFVNLLTFPAFLFAFGFLYEGVYLARGIRTMRVLRGAGKLLLAFAVSGVAYRFFITRSLDASSALKILLLIDIPPYSEFLASFFVVSLAFALGSVGFSWLVAKPMRVAVATAACFAVSFLPPPRVESATLSVFVGAHGIPCFPVVQFLPYFLLGLLFSRRRIVWMPRFALGCAALSAAFVISFMVTRVLPERFPPKFLWLAGAAGFVYAYYLLATFLARRVYFRALDAMGENTLFYLVVSNVLLFAVGSAHPSIGAWPAIALGFGVIAVIHFLLSLVRPAQGAPKTKVS